MDRFRHSAIPLSVEIMTEVSSTNTLIKEKAASGAPEGSLIIAQKQTAGRGRLGRSFFSPEGSGLYMSLLLRPEFDAEQSTMLTTAAAAAAALAIEDISGQAAGIKWVNDIWLNGKKVCGILCEASFSPSGKVDHVVVGVGMNISAPAGGFPSELTDIAGALFADGEAPEDASIALAAAFTRHFTRYYTNMDSSEYFPEYRKRCFLLGQEINILRGGDVIPATALDLDASCRLLVRRADGCEEYLSSGEVSIRPR